MSSIYLPNRWLRYWQCIGRGRPDRVQLYLLVRREDIFRNIFGRHGIIFRPLNKRNIMLTSICAIVETNKIQAYCILLSNSGVLGKVSWNPRRLSLDLYSHISQWLFANCRAGPPHIVRCNIRVVDAWRPHRDAEPWCSICDFLSIPRRQSSPRGSTIP